MTCLSHDTDFKMNVIKDKKKKQAESRGGKMDKCLHFDSVAYKIYLSVVLSRIYSLVMLTFSLSFHLTLTVSS